MYIKKVKVDESQIDGKGVFAQETIKEGEVVWIFKDGYDNKKTNEEFQQLAESEKRHLSHTAYLSPWSKMWVYPPYGDAAEYTNHSIDNNLGVVYDPAVSPEPIFIADRDIEIGEELTNNYHEFDETTKNQKPDWAA